MAPRASLEATRRLRIEWRRISTSPPHEQISVAPDPNNILHWHFVFHDLPEDTPYAGGVYHGKLEFKPEYPFSPPRIVMFTPNGRFATDTSICFSMSEFHPESWNPSWTVQSILIGALSFMLDSERTTGCVEASESERRELAAGSLAQNLGNAQFVKFFPQYKN